MYVTLTNGTKVKLFIQHDKDHGNPRFKVITRAKLFTEDGTTQIGNTGESRCFAGDEKTPPDNFCRRTGVKRALARAFKNAGINKGDRKAIWKKVLNLK